MMRSTALPAMATRAATFPPHTSLLAMAATVRSGGPAVEIDFTPLQSLVQAYRVAGHDAQSEVTQATAVMRHLLDRLRRLPAAYGEWANFDAPAYFDLTLAQSALLVQIEEGVTVVHAMIHSDLLLPTVRNAWHTLYKVFSPACAAMHNHPEASEWFFSQAQPAMIERWQQAVAVARSVRQQLAGDIGFWAANGADEERWRWRAAWREPALPGIDQALLPALADVPTLILEVDFPLPAYRQPGRLRRLRANRRYRNLVERGGAHQRLK